MGHVSSYSTGNFPSHEDTVTSLKASEKKKKKETHTVYILDHFIVSFAKRANLCFLFYLENTSNASYLNCEAESKKLYIGNYAFFKSFLFRIKSKQDAVLLTAQSVHVMIILVL